MNFKPNKRKLVVSIVAGLAVAVANYTRQLVQGINPAPINYFEVVLVWPISVIVVYIIYSLLEKRK